MMRVLLIVGSIFLLSGSLLFGMVYLGIANYVPHMTGWSDPPGKFALAMDATIMRAPYVISILFMIIGILLLSFVTFKALSKREREAESPKSSFN
jgi:hypothetical protein